MANLLKWVRCEHGTAFVAITRAGTYRVHWLPDAHSWMYDGRPFEHFDMAKAAAQTEHDIKHRETDG